MNEPARYVSFLVRLWREPDQESPAPPAGWHSVVEYIQSDQRWVFSILEELLDFLRRQTEQLGGTGWWTSKQLRLRHRVRSSIPSCINSN